METTMETTTEIKLVQAPVIQHKLVELGNQIDKRLSDLNLDKIIATEETLQSLKKLRAELNRENKTLTEYFNSVINIALDPINAVKNLYKINAIEKYRASDEILKLKIESVEIEIKSAKRKIIQDYFNELCVSEKIDFIPFEKCCPEINMSTSEKAYKKRCLEYITKVIDDMNLIKTEEYQAEIMTEYKKILSITQAIINVRQRKDAEKRETERIAAQKKTEPEQQTIFTSGQAVSPPDPTTNVEILSAPIVENQKENATFDEEMMTASFKVTGTKTQLLSLGQYLRDNKISYINL